MSKPEDELRKIRNILNGFVPWNPHGGELVITTFDISVIYLFSNFPPNYILTHSELSICGSEAVQKTIAIIETLLNNNEK